MHYQWAWSTVLDLFYQGQLELELCPSFAAIGLLYDLF
jgi:hypothetical protein